MRQCSDAGRLPSVNSFGKNKARAAIIRHVDFSDYQPLLPNSNSAVIAEKMKLQADLIRNADHVFAVGPILYANTKHMAKSITELTPGFTVREQNVRTEVLSVGIFGRLADSDDSVKQASVGVFGFARLLERVNKDKVLRKNSFWRDARLTLVGVPQEQSARIKAEVQAAVGAPVNLHTFDYVDSPVEAHQLLDSRNVNLGIFPSLRESFGLVAAEFMGLGIPIIISERTGVFRWLEETFGGEALGCITRFSGRGSIESGKPHPDDLDQMCDLMFEVGHNLDSKVRDASTLQKKVSPHDWRSTARQIVLDLGIREESKVEVVEQWTQQAAQLQMSFGSRVSKTIAEVRVKELVKEAESAISLARYRLAEEKLNSLRTAGVHFDSSKTLQCIQAEVFLRSGLYQQALAIVEKASGLYPRPPISSFPSSQDLRLEGVRNVALRDLGRYQEAVGHARSLVDWSKEMLKSDTLAEEERERGQARLASSLRKRSRCEAFVGDVKAAVESLEAISELSLISEDVGNIGKNNFAYGEVARHSGDYEGAISHYVKSIGVSELTGDLDLYTWSCLCLSDAHFMLGTASVARSYLELATSAIKLFDEGLPVERSHIELSFLALDLSTGVQLIDSANQEGLIKVYGDRGVEWVASYLVGLARNRRAPFAKRF